MFTYEDFSYKSFVDYVIKAMKLEEIEPEIKEKIELEITKTLADRILLSVIQGMTDDELNEFENYVTEDSDLSDFEALYAIVGNNPVLAALMMKNINDLADELTRDVEKLDQLLAEKSKK